MLFVDVVLRCGCTTAASVVDSRNYGSTLEGQIPHTWMWWINRLENVERPCSGKNHHKVLLCIHVLCGIFYKNSVENSLADCSKITYFIYMTRKLHKWIKFNGSFMTEYITFSPRCSYITAHITNRYNGYHLPTMDLVKAISKRILIFIGHFYYFVNRFSCSYCESKQ